MIVVLGETFFGNFNLPPEAIVQHSLNLLFILLSMKNANFMFVDFFLAIQIFGDPDAEMISLFLGKHHYSAQTNM